MACRDGPLPRLHFTVGRARPCGRHSTRTPREEVCCRVGLASLLPLVGIAVLFWPLMIRPPSAASAINARCSRPPVGDEVMLLLGIFGTVIRPSEDDDDHVELAPGVVIEVAAEAVGRRSRPPRTESEDDETAADSPASPARTNEER